MKYFILLGILFLLMTNSVLAVKIATLNVQSGVGTTKGYWQYATTFWKYFLPHSQSMIERAAHVIRDEDVDIVTLTEVDAGSFRSSGVNQAEYIANRTGLKNIVLIPTYSRLGIFNNSNAILTKYPIIASGKQQLQGKGEPRYIGWATMHINKSTVTVFVTHLSLDQDTRKAQLGDIAGLIKGMSGALIITGDFNTEDKKELDILKKEGLKEAERSMTFPSWKPQKAFDHIFTRGILVQHQYTKSDAKLSDHLPLVAEVSLPQ